MIFTVMDSDFPSIVRVHNIYTKPLISVNYKTPQYINDSISTGNQKNWDSNVIVGFEITAVVILILLTVVGNILVMLAIRREKNLRHESNYLVFSLALTDLPVGLLVMPLAALEVVTNRWNFGAITCQAWIFLDVFCCSASILHLLSVAVDRYLSVSLVRVKWSARKNRMSIYSMIILSWLIAATVAFPLISLKDSRFYDRLNEGQCLASQDIGFMIYAVVATFYLPLLLILLLYWMIWVSIRRRYLVRVENIKNRTTILEASLSTVSFPRDSHRNKDNPEAITNNVPIQGVSVPSTVAAEPDETVQPKPKKQLNDDVESGAFHRLTWESHAMQREALESQRVSRAARTLTIITGGLVISWFPFYTILIVNRLCGESCNIGSEWLDFVQWLGYSNSALNPLLYTIFSADFRRAFSNILCRKGLMGSF